MNVGYIGAKQTWETAMDDEVANAGKTSRANFPWLAAYPAGVPARIETPRLMPRTSSRRAVTSAALVEVVTRRDAGFIT